MIQKGFFPSLVHRDDCQLHPTAARRRQHHILCEVCVGTAEERCLRSLSAGTGNESDPRPPRESSQQRGGENENIFDLTDSSERMFLRGAAPPDVTLRFSLRRSRRAGRERGGAAGPPDHLIHTTLTKPCGTAAGECYTRWCNT